MSNKKNNLNLSAAKWVVLGVVLLILTLGTVYTVNEQEQAVVITFGKAEAVTSPGIHFKIPLFQQVEKVNTTIQGFTIGYDEGADEYQESDSLMITSDYNFVNIDFFVEWRCTDPVLGLYASEKPVYILRNICQSCIRSTVSAYNVDDVLTNGKNEIQAAIKAKVIEELDKQNIGIQLVNITIQDSEPPTEEVMQAFKSVETAKQEKETIVNNANKYRNEKLPEAQATANGILQDAEAQKTQRINEATAQVARFDAMYSEYVKHPDITRKRMFYEAMEEVLPELKVVIQGDSSELQTIYPVESFN